MSVPPSDTGPSDDELRLHLMGGLPDVSLAFQAIVDLNRGVVSGYEVLARFAAPLDAAPDRWLGAAVKMGRGREIETAIWRAAFEAGSTLPSGMFISINASPDFLASNECATLLGSRATLEGVVVEVTEHEAITDYDRLSASLARYRARGAAVAVDDAGAGYASMSHVLALRPEYIKLDRAIVTNCDLDPAKAALVEMVGSFAGRIDSLLIAEGVEREGELATLTRMGVPLGQGFFLATPQPVWSDPTPTVSSFLMGRARSRAEYASVRAFVEVAPAVEGEEAAAHLLTVDERIDVVVLVDELRRPFSLAVREGSGVRFRANVLRVHAAAEVRDIVLRALTRDAGVRFDPIACTHDDGSLLGILRIEHLVEHLAKGNPPLRASA
jgi:EAL domain-containing protein (putative c-di-GMP-specific phosphodiesterase class I)